jgi:hypothetical protein
MPSTPPPETLGDAGKALWNSVAARYGLRPDEQAILEDACATADMIAALEDAWITAGRPMVSEGSMGQEVIHPLIGEMRAQRSYRDAALVRLKLPDTPAAGKGAASGSGKARKAAAARWANGA